MSYVVAATYLVREGAAEQVAELLAAMTPHARAESGCLAYRAHRSVENPRLFFLYEEYRDEQGFAAHAESDHFERYIRRGAWPLLDSRTVVRAEPLD